MDRTLIKAITIDAIGTLVEPRPSVGAIYAKTLSSAGALLPQKIEQNLENHFQKIHRNLSAKHALSGITERNEKKFWHQIIQQTLEACVPKVTEIQLKAWIRLLWEQLAKPENWDEIPGSRPPIEVLTRCAYPVYIFSNADGRLHKILKGLGLTTLVQDVFLATDIGYRKPHPQAFAAVQDALGLEPAEILHVGNDSEADVHGALAAGWQTAYLGDDIVPKGTLKLNRLGDLVELLLEQNNGNR